MSRHRIIIAVLVLHLSSLACKAVMGEDSIGFEMPSSPSPGVPPPAGATDPSCPLITGRILEANFASPHEETADNSDFGGREDNLGTYLVSYRVSGDEIRDPSFEQVPPELQDERDDTTTHQKIWDYFTDLIPQQDRKALAEFSIMTDGRDNVLAAVAQTSDDPSRWSLEVDIEDSKNSHLLTFTLIHEFVHILTLGPDQVPPSEAIFSNPNDNDIYLREASACPNFFPGEGCSNADSYLNSFYDRFWEDLYEEWNEINLEQIDEVYYERLDDFYVNHQDQFVSDYSVTHPAEDIAESFSLFVLSPQPAGDTIAEQKILFFYEYPELVDLRDQILANLCASFPE